MNKVAGMVASCVLLASMMAGTAFAKSDNAKDGDHGDFAKQESGQAFGLEPSGTSNSVSGNAASSVSGSADRSDDNGKADNQELHHPNLTVTGSTYGDDHGGSVTSSTYGPQGYRGLLHAIENVQDKPAGAVIADLLLTRYQAHLSDEMKAQLEAIQAKDAALSAAADVLEQQGDVTDAVYTEKEAIKANIRNLNSYVKLSKLYEQMGKTGVKLYVNGDEPTTDLAPFIKNDVTLVPFRAIAEALQADVTWNNDERSVTVTRHGTTVKLYIDSMTATVNGVEVPLEVPATIVDDHTVVPVRFVSEAFKATVNWDGETQSVIIVEDQK